MVRVLRRRRQAASAPWRPVPANQEGWRGTMAILLDSASVDDAAAAAELGFVHGITTNPALMARETKEPLAHLERLLTAFPSGSVCYQPTRTSHAEMNDEARAAAS